MYFSIVPQLGLVLLLADFITAIPSPIVDSWVGNCNHNNCYRAIVRAESSSSFCARYLQTAHAPPAPVSTCGAVAISSACSCITATESTITTSTTSTKSTSSSTKTTSTTSSTATSTSSSTKTTSTTSSTTSSTSSSTSSTGTPCATSGAICTPIASFVLQGSGSDTTADGSYAILVPSGSDQILDFTSLQATATIFSLSASCQLETSTGLIANVITGLAQSAYFFDATCSATRSAIICNQSSKNTLQCMDVSGNNAITEVCGVTNELFLSAIQDDNLGCSALQLDIVAS